MEIKIQENKQCRNILDLPKYGWYTTCITRYFTRVRLLERFGFKKILKSTLHSIITDNRKFRSEYLFCINMPEGFMASDCIIVSITDKICMECLNGDNYVTVWFIVV